MRYFFLILFCVLKSSLFFCQEETVKRKFGIQAEAGVYPFLSQRPFLYSKQGYDLSVGAHMEKKLKKKNSIRAIELNLGIFDYSVRAPDLDTSNLPLLFNYYNTSNYPRKENLVYNHMRLTYFFADAGMRWQTDKRMSFTYGFSLAYYRLISKNGVKEYDPVEYGWNSPPGVPSHSSYRLTKSYYFPEQEFVPFLVTGFKRDIAGNTFFGEAKLNMLVGFILFWDRTKFPDNNNGLWCNINPFLSGAGKISFGFRRLF